MTALRALTIDEVLQTKKGPGVAYDYSTVIRNMADKGGQHIPRREKEHSERIQEQMGGRVPLGTYIPLDAKVRDLTTGAATGSYLAGTETDFTFSDVLRAASVAGRIGATMVYGVKGNLVTPVFTTGVTAEWVAEGTAPSDSDAVVSQLSFAPNSIAVSFNLTKQLVMQIGPSGEAAFLRDVSGALGATLDVALLHGGGTTEPVGIENTANIGTQSGADFSRATALATVGKVLTANVPEREPSLAWVFSVADFLLLRNRLNDPANVSSGRVIEDDLKLAGYPVYVSTACEEGKAFFGKWSEAIIPTWAVDITINPYTQSKAAVTEFTAFQFVDVGVRVPQAFVLVSSIS